MKRNTFTAQIVITLNPDGSIADARKSVVTIVTEENDAGDELVIAGPTSVTLPMTEDAGVILGDALASALVQIEALKAAVADLGLQIENLTADNDTLHGTAEANAATIAQLQRDIAYRDQRIDELNNPTFAAAADEEG